MALHNPPLYRYSFSDPRYREAFLQIKELATLKKYPTVLGSEQEKNQFLITLIRTQKALHGWEQILFDVLQQIKDNNSIDTREWNEKYPASYIGKDKPAWVTYSEDEIVNNFIDELAMREIRFVGTDDEISEFVLRFILGQLGSDWEMTIMMIWELLGEGNMLQINEANTELKNFDYMKIFENNDNI